MASRAPLAYANDRHGFGGPVAGRERGVGKPATAAKLQYLGIADLKTGEVAPVVQLRRPYAYPSRAYTTVSDEIRNLYPYELSSLELKIFFELLLTHAEGEFRPVVVKSTADLLDTYPANVSRALAHLVTIVAILKGPKHQRSFTYMINPLLGFRGPGEKHQLVFVTYAQPLADPESVRRPKARQKQKEGGA